MSKLKRCDSRCHQAKGTKCRCWCGGFFHGRNGGAAINRAALAGGMIEIAKLPGYKKMETKYIEQLKLEGG